MPTVDVRLQADTEPSGRRRAAEPRNGSVHATSGELNRHLAEVTALFGDEIAAVDSELHRFARDGLSPAVESATHLLDAGGKRVRPLTVILSAACFGTPPESVRDVAVAAELVHLATLLHDDVVDDGQERRGRPTSRRIWGNAVSVLSGDLLLTHALQLTAARASPSVLADLLKTLRRLVDGEVIQLQNRLKIDVTEETYLRIARNKTASLFEWSARSGARCANASPDAIVALGAFGAHLGLAFQLIDDVLDYAGDARSLGKSLFADLLDGKLTLPLIRAIASRPSLAQDIESIRMGDRRVVPRVAESVRSSGACASVRALAREETLRAAAALEAVPAGSARNILERIAHGLADRAG